MTATAQAPLIERISSLRGRCAATTPRITRREIADRIDRSEQWVKMILGNTAPSIPEETVGLIERAVCEIEAERAKAA